MRPLAVAVQQIVAELDPEPALAALPVDTRYVLRPPALSSLPAPAGARVLAVDAGDRERAAALVRRECPAAVVVVLAADEQVSDALGAALVELRRRGEPGAYAVRRVSRFLGREIEDGKVVIAWLGEPGDGPPGLLPGVLLRVGRNLAEEIGDMDARAACAAALRPTATFVDLSLRPAVAFARRLWLRRRCGVPGVVLSVIETYGEVLTAAKVRERELAARSDEIMRARLDLPQGFTVLDGGTGFVVVREGVGEHLVQAVLAATPDSVEGEPMVSGGRGGAWMVPTGEGGRAVFRWYRRGGALRHFVRDLYFGWRPRPVAELVLTERARRRGVPAVEVLAARVDRLRAGFYRGALVTREVERCETLAQVLRRGPCGGERDALLAAVAGALRRMHDCGVHHRDLNASNILVRWEAGCPDVRLIDFDRADLRTTVRAGARRRALRRLARSLAKIDRRESVVTADDRAAFHRCYWKGQ